MLLCLVLNLFFKQQTWNFEQSLDDDLWIIELPWWWIIHDEQLRVVMIRRTIDEKSTIESIVSCERLSLDYACSNGDSNAIYHLCSCSSLNIVENLVNKLSQRDEHKNGFFIHFMHDAIWSFGFMIAKRTTSDVEHRHRRKKF